MFQDFVIFHKSKCQNPLQKPFVFSQSKVIMILPSLSFFSLMCLPFWFGWCSLQKSMIIWVSPVLVQFALVVFLHDSLHWCGNAYLLQLWKLLIKCLMGIASFLRNVFSKPMAYWTAKFQSKILWEYCWMSVSFSNQRLLNNPSCHCLTSSFLSTDKNTSCANSSAPVKYCPKNIFKKPIIAHLYLVLL